MTSGYDFENMRQQKRIVNRARWWSIKGPDGFVSCTLTGVVADGKSPEAWRGNSGQLARVLEMFPIYARAPYKVVEMTRHMRDGLVPLTTRTYRQRGEQMTIMDRCGWRAG